MPFRELTWKGTYLLFWEANKMAWIRFNEPFGTEEIVKMAVETVGLHLYEQRTVEEQLRQKMASLELYQGIAAPFFMQSGTAALEVMALAMEFTPGEEVILPSFTYPATANAFLMAGARLVFADIEPDTLNLDPKSVERLLSSRTKAIVPIHYGGVAADVPQLEKLAESCGAVLLEDAAHCIGASFRGKPLGTFGAMGTLSFHSTKNITSAGFGGCLFVEDPNRRSMVEEITVQGTDRAAYRAGRVSAYRWKRQGGEYVMPVFSMAYLRASLERLEEVTERRKMLWKKYHELLSPLEEEGFLKLCKVPESAGINGHVFYVLLKDRKEREGLKHHLHERRIEAFSHYEPLHDTVIGRSAGRCDGEMEITGSISGRILRLPMHMELSTDQVERICQAVEEFHRKRF